MASSPDAVVRPRTHSDLDACIALATEVHRVDGYPPFLPGGDVRALLTRPPALAAFVAVRNGAVAGHVALHPSRPSEAVALASRRLERDPAELGIVARLFTALACRGMGVGRALLHTAELAARERDLVPILDVWVDLRGAIALYEACGWQRLGTIDAELPDGRSLPEHVYCAR